MSAWSLATPVALVVFNRPDTTRQVMNVVRQARPPMLLVVADGPRLDRPGEAQRCAEVRGVVEAVDWPCEVLTNYSDVNLGCRQRVATGLTWVFDQVEEAIILEDDCVPHPSFFRFCEELLTRYRYNNQVMIVSGDNFQMGRQRTKDSYYYSRYPHIWGWATWRRAWRLFDDEMRLWPEVRDGGWLKDLFGSYSVAGYWRRHLQAAYDRRIDTWDYGWAFACWVYHGLCVLPNVNLVTNIGFNVAATNTRGNSRVANLAAEEMRFPLAYPPFMIADERSDALTASRLFRSAGMVGYVKWALRVLSQQLGRHSR
ncbi:MAG: glycosyltransferase family 2 protein [Anaerolineales bacterium]|nr:glycosyltransferase family 2 protein [Anaerolineales bacterium]